MHVLRYTLLHLRRRPLQFVCMLIAVILLTCMLLHIHSSMQVRQAGLNAMVNESVIWCVIEQMDSTRWAASAYHVSQLLNPTSSTFADFVQTYVTDVRARVTLNIIAAEFPFEIEVCFLTCWEADDTLYLLDNRRLTMTPGYDTSVLLSNEDVCIAGSNIAALGQTLTISLPENCGGKEISLRVVGIIEGDDSIYCSWLLYEHNVPDLFAATPADSLSFRLKDNQLINLFQQDAAAFYAPSHAKSEKQANREYSLVVRDAQFRENVLAANRNVMLMRWIQPIFLLLTLGTGILITALILRARQVEYAILRSIGLTARFILLSSMTETLLAVLPGCMVALLLQQSKGFSQTVPLMMSFIFGSLLPTIRYITSPILQQMKGAL